MSRTEKLRRLARRLNVENARLIKLVGELREANLPMVATDIYNCAFKVGMLSLALNHVADVVRDPRGAQVDQSSQKRA
jgi:hypothetical protein